MVTRRDFIRLGTAAGGGLYLSAKIGGVRYLIRAQIPGGSLDPTTVSKFVTPLLIPPVMPRASTTMQMGGKPIDYYEISVRHFSQQILPAGHPPTTVWGYGAVKSDSKKGLLIHNAPSHTIEAEWNRPVRVKWIKDLKGVSGNYLPPSAAVCPRRRSVMVARPAS